MIKRVKIFGAGSIGNHLAHASRQLGWDVVVCDVNTSALDRMKNEIYPTRYGAWDKGIQLFLNADAPKGDFDLILIGTPPEYHLPLGMAALDEKPKALLLEKPLATPSLAGCLEFWEKSKAGQTKVFVGYTHVVGKSMQKMESLIQTGQLGKILTLDVEFREHWEGIFKAHPWLSGPQDTYLGYWQKGGGASGEHSHAMNLWQHLAHVLGFGRVSEVSATLTYVNEGRAQYDNLCLLQLQTEKGLTGRVVQDVVTRPSRKMARIQGSLGAIEWWANYDAHGDAILVFEGSTLKETIPVSKKRPDDFIEELRHVDQHLNQKSSPLMLERGMDTMLLLEAVHQSAREKKSVNIHYEKIYRQEALHS